MEEDEDDIPIPPTFKDLEVEHAHQVVTLMTVNMPLIRSQVQRTSIKKH